MYNCIFAARVPIRKKCVGKLCYILAEKSDTELERFLSPLMTWLQDLNWPGSDIILYRLQQLTEKTNVYYRIAYHNCTTCAKALNDLVWEENLKKMDAGISWRHKNH